MSIKKMYSRHLRFNVNNHHLSVSNWNHIQPHLECRAKTSDISISILTGTWSTHWAQFYMAYIKSSFSKITFSSAGIRVITQMWTAKHLANTLFPIIYLFPSLPLLSAVVVFLSHAVCEPAGKSEMSWFGCLFCLTKRTDTHIIGLCSNKTQVTTFFYSFSSIIWISFDFWGVQSLTWNELFWIKSI